MSLGGVSGRACARFGYANAAAVQVEGLAILRNPSSCVRGCPLPDDTLKPRLCLGVLNPEGPYLGALTRRACGTRCASAGRRRARDRIDALCSYLRSLRSRLHLT